MYKCLETAFGYAIPWKPSTTENFEIKSIEGVIPICHKQPSFCISHSTKIGNQKPSRLRFEFFMRFSLFQKSVNLFVLSAFWPTEVVVNENNDCSEWVPLECQYTVWNKCSLVARKGDIFMAASGDWFSHHNLTTSYLWSVAKLVFNHSNPHQQIGYCEQFTTTTNLKHSLV